MSKETTTPKLEYKTVEDNGQPRAARRIRSRHLTMTKAATQGFIHAMDADEEEGGASSPHQIETAGSLVGVLVGIPMGLWVIGCLQSNYNPGYLHQIIFIDYNALASILSKDCECFATLSPTEAVSISTSRASGRASQRIARSSRCARFLAAAAHYPLRRA